MSNIPTLYQLRSEAENLADMVQNTVMQFDNLMTTYCNSPQSSVPPDPRPANPTTGGPLPPPTPLATEIAQHIDRAHRLILALRGSMENAGVVLFGDAAAPKDVQRAELAGLAQGGQVSNRRSY